MYQWESADILFISIKEIPLATDHDKMNGEKGFLEPIWTEGKNLPFSEDDIQGSCQPRPCT